MLNDLTPSQGICHEQPTIIEQAERLAHTILLDTIKPHGLHTYHDYDIIISYRR